MAPPTIGKTVLYRLSEHDAGLVNQLRSDAEAYRREHRLGLPGRSGYIAHRGNPVSPGDVFPATVVRVWNGTAIASLQVHLDGNDCYWATSRQEGDGAGCWAWPDIQREPEPVAIATAIALDDPALH